jgi:ubiquitin-protein ligase
MNLRIKRLYNEYNELCDLFRDHPHIVIKSFEGEPPHKYIVEYRVKGLYRDAASNIVRRNNHLVEIMLPSEYPTVQPICRMMDPVYHPNVDSNSICIADFWAASESIADMLIRIGEIITFQNYNIKSPLNAEAAVWAGNNLHLFPIDPVHLSFVAQRTKEVPDTSASEPPTPALKPTVPEALPTTHTTDNEPFIPTIPTPAIEPAPVQPPAKPEQVSEEIKQDESCKCSNCEKEGIRSQFHHCDHDHYLCSDCTIECQGCGKNLCVVCEINMCAVCGKVLCANCIVACEKCGLHACNEHQCACIKSETTQKPDIIEETELAPKELPVLDNSITDLTSTMVYQPDEDQETTVLQKPPEILEEVENMPIDIQHETEPAPKVVEEIQEVVQDIETIPIDTERSSIRIICNSCIDIYRDFKPRYCMFCGAQLEEDPHGHKECREA